MPRATRVLFGTGHILVRISCRFTSETDSYVLIRTPPGSTTSMKPASTPLFSRTHLPLPVASVDTPGIEEVAVCLVDHEDMLAPPGLQERQECKGDIAPPSHVRQVELGKFLSQRVMLVAVVGQARETVFLHKFLLAGKVADGVLDNILQELADDGVCMARLERRVELGDHREESLVLIIQVFDLDGIVIVPAIMVSSTTDHGHEVTILESESSVR